MTAKETPSIHVLKTKAPISARISNLQIIKSKSNSQARTIIKATASPSPSASLETRSTTELLSPSINQEGEEEEEPQGKNTDPSSPLSISTSQISTIAASQAITMETVWRDIAKANYARRTQKRQEVYRTYISALDKVVQQRAGRWMEKGEERDREWRTGVAGRVKDALQRKQMMEIRMAEILQEWDGEIGRVVRIVRERIKTKRREGGKEKDEQYKREEGMAEYEEEEEAEGEEEEEGKGMDKGGDEEGNLYDI